MFTPVCQNNLLFLVGITVAAKCFCRLNGVDTRLCFYAMLQKGTAYETVCLLPCTLNLTTFNPVALGMAKTPWGFGQSECNRVKAGSLMFVEEGLGGGGDSFPKYYRKICMSVAGCDLF